MRSPVGLKPTIPQKAGGIFRDPAQSVPMPSGEQRADISPASPPEEPPVVRLLSQGFVQRPQSRLIVSNERPICGVLDLTKGIAPAIFRTVIIGASSVSLLKIP